MLARGLGTEVNKYVQEWVPEQNYRTQAEFRDELQAHLDHEFNFGVVAMGMDNIHDDVPVETVSEARIDPEVEVDLLVDEEVGILVYRELSGATIEELPATIDAAREAYSAVVVVACGLRDASGWAELEDEYQGAQLSVTSDDELYLVHKKREHFGMDPEQLRDDDGGFFSGWF